MKARFIIDTDIGDDIDDVLALFLAFKLEMNVIGITTVFKNTHLRARMAKKCLKLLNKDIPVYAGRGLPLSGDRRVSDETVFCQFTPDLYDAEFSPINDSEGCAGDSAIDFIINSAQEYGQDLTIICIGPLTNLACAIQKNPEAMSKVGRIVAMGGDFCNHFREWNILCDIDAADIVMNSNIPLEFVSHNVTTKVELSQQQFDELLNSYDEGAKGYLYDLIRLYAQAYGRPPILHDPLAVYYAVYPDALEMERIPAYLETEGRIGRGMTFNMETVFRFDKKAINGYKYINYSKELLKKDFVQTYLDLIFKS
ncbi:MAG TPA: nucleoside hydrolase [Clostridia bacterium]